MSQFDLQVQREYLGLLDKKLKIVNPFDLRTPKDVQEPHMHLLRMMSNPEYFYFTCKHLLGVELLPFQCVLLQELWQRPFPMLIGSRGMGKSFILGLYAVLRALFIQGRKVVLTGSGFRQAKTIFNYAETIWFNSPILRSLVAESDRSGPHHDADRWWMGLGDSTITALPLGDGTKIRGERAHDIIADEFASIPRETFETVVAGFGVVELDPVNKVKQRARIRVLKKEGLWTEEMAEQFRVTRMGNQTVISGTAFYQFNHFAEYWRKWHNIISSQGDEKKLREIFPDGIPEGFDYRDYSIFRLPVELLPEGFMDERQVARSKATVHTGIYTNEFGACFSSDTKGFFKRSLVESCVTDTPVEIDGLDVQFKPVTRGNPTGHYIYGIDPASEHDRFSIVILEGYPSHRRIVYCWTTTRQEHNARVQARLTDDRDFYGYCCRKIRDLMKVFPCEHIALDSQGGGIAVVEALHDPDKIADGEKPIWPITMDHPLSDGKERPTDAYPGLHIVEMVNFADAKWTADANHGMRKDFEDKVLLFPMSANSELTIELAIANEIDQKYNRIFDTLEDAVKEIEELKEELATISHTQTPGSNRDRWDTPEVKLEGSRKGRLRKDRYSSLLMANAAARRLNRQPEQPVYNPIGGFADKITAADGAMYTSAPDWFSKPLEGDYDNYGWITGEKGVR